MEDSPTDAYVIEEAMRMSGLTFELHSMRDGEAAMAAVGAPGEALPDLVLLDLNLPRVSGLQILSAIRESPALHRVPVVVVTSSDFKGDRDAVAKQGAAAYFCKPHDLDEFLKLGELVKSVL